MKLNPIWKMPSCGRVLMTSHLTGKHGGGISASSEFNRCAFLFKRHLNDEASGHGQRKRPAAETRQRRRRLGRQFAVPFGGRFNSSSVTVVDVAPDGSQQTTSRAQRRRPRRRRRSQRFARIFDAAAAMRSDQSEIKTVSFAYSTRNHQHSRRGVCFFFLKKKWKTYRQSSCPSFVKSVIYRHPFVHCTRFPPQKKKIPRFSIVFFSAICFN